MSAAGVVLAAGFSRRLGRPKQMVEIGGETLVERAVRVACEAGLDPVFVVINSDVQQAAALRELRCIAVLNAEAEEGIASSIRAGVRRAMKTTDVKGVVLMTCDQITTTADHLRAVCERPEAVTGSAYAGKIAVPAYFPRSSFTQLLALRGDTGAREILRNARGVNAESLNIDIDTEEDVMRAQRLFSGAANAGARER